MRGCFGMLEMFSGVVYLWWLCGYKSILTELVCFPIPKFYLSRKGKMGRKSTLSLLGTGCHAWRLCTLPPHSWHPGLVYS